MFFTGQRRKRLRSQPFPPAWEWILEKGVPLYGRLLEPDRRELRGHIQVFLAEKQFEGANGMAISDEVRLTVAAQACLLLLHRETDYFPGLSSIVVYPGEFVAMRYEVDEAGVVTEGDDVRSGESFEGGALVLSWEDVRRVGIDVHDGYNVVLHEFAHQLDAEDGLSGGEPLLARGGRSRRWTQVLRQEYEQLVQDAEEGYDTFLDPYGAENPGEFFAVATEAFFLLPEGMREYHPELYEILAQYYCQDPATDWGR